MRDHSAKGSVVRVISSDFRSRTGVVDGCDTGDERSRPKVGVHRMRRLRVRDENERPGGANRPGRVQGGIAIQRRPVRWPPIP